MHTPTRQITALAAAAGLTTALLGAHLVQAQETPAASTSAEIAEVSVKHTECFGPCPVYKVTIKRDGTATFVGTAHVTKIGNYTAGVYDFSHLAQAIQKRDFRHFQDKYTSLRSDSKHIITTVVYASGRRKVVDNYADAGPQELWETQTLIDGAAAEARWQKAGSPPLPLTRGR